MSRHPVASARLFRGRADGHEAGPRTFTPPPTCVARPWALVTRGGPRPDAVRPTRLAYLVDVVTSRGEVIAYRGHLMRADRTASTRHTQRIDLADIVRDWPGSGPSVWTIRRTRSRLRITEAARRGRRAA